MGLQPSDETETPASARKRNERLHLRELTDDELARRLEHRRCPSVEAEVCRRYGALAEALARKFDRQLYHRGRKCKGHGAGDGGCLGSYGDGRSEILRLILGSEEKLRPLFVRWGHRRKREQNFSQFVRLNVCADDVLRAWCSTRLLRQRCDRLPDAMIAELDKSYREFWARRPDFHAIAGLAPGATVRPQGRKKEKGLIEHWVEGLWRDAVQTGDGEVFDSVRLARWTLLSKDPSPEEVEAIRWLTQALDDEIADRWPVWYDDYLDSSRQQTQPCSYEEYNADLLDDGVDGGEDDWYGG